MEKINVKKYADSWKESFKNTVLSQNLINRLAVIQVKNDFKNKASDLYIKGIKNDCIDFGFGFELYAYEDFRDAFYALSQLNNNPEITGILVAYPLPSKHIEYHFSRLIDRDKDIDNISGESQKVYSCTAEGIYVFLDDIDMIENKNIVIINRSDIIGRPLADRLIDEDANVTILHSATSREKIKQFLDISDVIITATGCPDTITPDMLDIKDKEYHIIDAGVSFDSSGKKHGDVHPDVFNINSIKGWCTPVNNGVGLLTRCALMNNMYVLSMSH